MAACGRLCVETRRSPTSADQRDRRGMMGSDPQFGLFEDGEAGPLWRGFFAALDEAKLHAQALADKEGQPFFVFNLKMSCEVVRLYPSTIDSKVNLHIQTSTS